MGARLGRTEQVIVIDTHTLLWMAQDSPRLSATARSVLSEATAGAIVLSCLSLYEIAWLHERGRIAFKEPLEKFLAGVEDRFRVVALDRRIAITAAQLPASFPSDPFDRIIAATAIVERVPLITADLRIRNSGAVRTVW